MKPDLDKIRCLKTPRNLVSKSAGFSKWYNLSLHLYWFLCFLSFNTSSNRRRASLSGVCAAAGVVNQADDRHLLLPGYFTTPGWHRTTADETKNNLMMLLRDMMQELYWTRMWICSVLTSWFFHPFIALIQFPPIPWFGLTSVYSDVNSTHSQDEIKQRFTLWSLTHFIYPPLKTSKSFLMLSVF